MRKPKGPNTEADNPSAEPAPKQKSTREVDEFGFRPGCKKSEVMKLVKKGKTTLTELRKQFGGQVNYALRETLERTGTKTKVDEKSGIVKIV
jgi:hypothetical protein